MRVVYKMAVRNMLPETINQAARRVGRPLSAEQPANIQLKRVTQGHTVPRMRDQIEVLPDADPRAIESVVQGSDEVEVWLEDFDTDEIADDEAVAVEALLALGWEIDVD